MKSTRSIWLCALVLVCALAAPQVASAAPPANDAFADAPAITALPFDDTTDLTGATTEAGEPAFCYSASKSAWYTFAPTQDTTLAVSFTSSAFGGAVAVYTADGAGLAGLGSYACVDPFNQTATIPVTAGRTYVFQAHDVYGNLGTLGLHVEVYVPPTPPANDDFAHAVSIPAVPFDGNVDLTAATIEPGEAFTLPGHNCAAGVGSVWYEFTPSQDETLRVAASTTDNFGVYASVWREDGPGLAGLTGINCSAVGAIAPVKAGVTYAIDVVDYLGSTGLARLGIQIVSPPPNDDFANAHVISALPFSDAPDAVGATTQPGEITPTCAPGPIARSVWYSWTPSQDTFVNGGGSTWVDALYTGNTLSALTEVACGSARRFFIKALAGHTYWLQATENPDDLSDNPSQVILEETQGMTPTFEWTPAPSIADPVQFGETRSDPAGELSQRWTFGDGATGSGPYPTHRYRVDGTYHVTLTVTTTDGRTETAAADVEVKTHDVGILDVSAPPSARVGQTILVTVRAVSLRYTEILDVALATSRNNGESVGELIREVAVDKKGVTFSFPYTVTQADATSKHITFTATAYVLGLPDAFPGNNVKASKPATTIIGR